MARDQEARSVRSSANAQPLACRLLPDVDAALAFLDAYGDRDRDFELAVDDAGAASVLVSRTPHGAALLDWLVADRRAEPLPDIRRVITYKHLVEPTGEHQRQAAPRNHPSGSRARVSANVSTAGDVDDADRVTVLTVLTDALRDHRFVTIALRDGGSAAGGPRVIAGRPIAFSSSAQGRPRVVLVIADGHSEQWILIERIAQVIPLEALPAGPLR